MTVLDGPVQQPPRQLPAPVRVTLVEARRSAAPALFLGVAAMGVALLFVHPDAWVARWTALAVYLRTSLILVVPLCAAVAAWQGARERRRGTDDLLGATSRPAWQPLLATWTALVLAGAAGLLMTFVVAMVFVVPYASYAGGGWWWIALGCLPPLAAGTALGLAVGRWVPLRVVGLLLAVALYVAQALPTYTDDDPVVWLSPIMDGWYSYHRLSPGTHVLQAIWFSGLSLALLGVAALRSVPPAHRPALAALAAGVVLAGFGGLTLLVGPGHDRWQADPQARREVCAPGSPQVCVAAVDAYLLDEVTPGARSVLDRLAGVPGAPTRAAGHIYDHTEEPPDDALPLSSLIPGLDGGLVDDPRRWAGPIADAARSSLIAQACFSIDVSEPGAETRRFVEQVAAAWVLEGSGLGGGDEYVDPQVTAAGTALNRLSPIEQRAWIGQVYATRDRCDLATVTGLLAPLERP